MDIFAKLNDKQLLAVKNTEGFVRVIAGAGSGKTKLLVSRYAYLVKEYGIDSANILCVTFTNKAAAEMKKRITKLIGPEYSTSLICTYHGFCARLIRENPEKLFLTKGFQIIDTWQQKTILEEIFQKYELKLDYANFQSIIKKITHKKQDLSYVPKMCTADEVQILSEIKDQDDKIIEDYLQRQKAIYSLDFTDLMSYALYLLENDEEVRNKWQERLNYIMVDEFQDSSITEMKLVDILSARYQNLMIVGDPDQNIYEWRGSDVRLLVDFDKTHPGKLEGDINKARRREADFKNKQQRKINFKKKQWKRSARAHEYLKIKNHLVVIFHYKDSGKWNFALDNVFSKKTYNSREECLEAIFNALEELLYN